MREGIERGNRESEREREGERKRERQIKRERLWYVETLRGCVPSLCQGGIHFKGFGASKALKFNILRGLGHLMPPNPLKC